MRVIGAMLLCCSCGGGGNGDERSRAAADGSAGLNVRVEGRVTFSDGAPMNERPIDAQVLLVTQKGEAAGDPACPEVTQHRAAETLRPDARGAYALELDQSRFVALSHPDCPIEKLGGARIQTARVSALAAADASTCRSYCRAQSGAATDAPEEDACVRGCEQSGQIRAEARAETADGSLSGQRGASIRLDLELDELAPLLSFDPGVSALPDLLVDPSSVGQSWSIQTRSFSASDCASVEGCLSGTGPRRLLVFDSVLANLGQGPLHIGAPSDRDDAVYDACHAHHHLGSAMLYELIKGGGDGGEVVARGRKQGFCLMDSAPVSGTGPGRYDCDLQGISPGWADVYDRTLDCQWIDVTGVAPGAYRLRLTANPDFAFLEADHSNNTLEVPVTIGASP